MRLRRTQWRHARNTKVSVGDRADATGEPRAMCRTVAPSDLPRRDRRTPFCTGAVAFRGMLRACSATSRSHGRFGRPGVQQQRALC